MVVNRKLILQRSNLICLAHLRHINISTRSLHFHDQDVRDFTICSNINGLGLRSNVVNDFCPLILHQLVIGCFGKACTWSDKWYQSQGHRFESLEPHCEGGTVRDFTIHSSTNGLGLRSNAIKDLCPLILHQLVVGWIGKAHGPTQDKLT